MIQKVVICLASFALFDCKGTIAVPITTENPVILPSDKANTSQNEMTDFQKKSLFINQQNVTFVKNDDQIQRKSKVTRQVLNNFPVASVSTSMENINAGQSFYASPIMMYPFPMMNTYHPRYFPYTYNPGYQSYGYPFIG